MRKSTKTRIKTHYGSHSGFSGWHTFMRKSTKTRIKTPSKFMPNESVGIFMRKSTKTRIKTKVVKTKTG